MIGILLKPVLKPHVNPLSPELNLICYLLALLAHDFLHVSRIRVKTMLKLDIHRTNVI
jgi:hypothetical protein